MHLLLYKASSVWLSGQIITALLLSVSQICVAQVRDTRSLQFTSIKATFSHSRRIPYNTVEVLLQYRRDSIVATVHASPMALHKEQWSHTKVDTTFTIPVAVYAKVFSAVAWIDPRPFVEDLGIHGIDGSTCAIECEGLRQSVRYVVWSPTYNTKSQGLTGFLSAFRAILKAAHLPAGEILGD